MANPTIAAVCFEHMISLEDFFGPLRSRHIVAARRDAILRLRALGLSYRACARIMRRRRSMVRYWLRDGVRERKRMTMRARKAKLAQIPIFSPTRDAVNNREQVHEVAL